jgi:hypothetical protein
VDIGGGVRPDRLTDEQLEQLHEELFGDVLADQRRLAARVAHALVAMGWQPPEGWEPAVVGFQVSTMLGSEGGERDVADYLRVIEQRPSGEPPRPLEDLLPVARMALRVIRHHQSGGGEPSA